ncbi:MAG: peptidyl-prolyl cis-trans isomerase cyclophilin type [Myxococcales bacterium]|nr:peptidyl-prolyl cis-trans isomerase cyclophilin type [Myxococcales bacterium]
MGAHRGLERCGGGSVALVIASTRVAIVLVGVVGLLALGCGGSEATADAATDTPPNADAFIVDVTTSKGVFALEVNPSWAPNGAARFRELVEAGFYNDARFFRVVRGFVVQFGINGTPATNAMWSNRTIPDDPVVRSNTRGYVTFAQSSAPNSRTTQLFVNLGNNARLDGMRFAPFAVVISGMDVVDRLNAEYGEAPDQTQISEQGNAYLNANFPRLDYIVSAQVR